MATTASAPDVTVLRMGHRPQRDKRITTHVFLTARAFGARRGVLTTPDPGVEASLAGVVERFGGPFELTVRDDWRALIRRFPGPCVHLTMYGQPHTGVVSELRGEDEVLVVVGAEKVPAALYELATFNVAVGNQPHSEVAALATVLYEVLGPEALVAPRTGAALEVVAQERGKRVLPRDGAAPVDGGANEAGPEGSGAAAGERDRQPRGP